MQKQQKNKIYRKFEGEVVGDKINKTIIVRVDRIKIHPRYKKRYKVSKRYKVHDEKNKARVGNTVEFIECRPLSKEKRWRILKIIK